MKDNKSTISNEHQKLPNSSRFFENTSCEYYPCHQGISQMNCLFCYCPLYGMEPCPGKNEYIEKNGKRIKVCTNCTYPHEPKNYDEIMEFLRKR